MADDARAPVLVTGAAGFIGFHIAQRLLAEGRAVVGLDNLNSYYDPALKQARLDQLAKSNSFQFFRRDLTDRAGTAALFAEHRFARVLHFAAQAGVRLSLTDPHAYVDDNIHGFLNVLEGCRQHGCGHLVYASSSSVYGANTGVPFSVHDGADHPVSIYAVSKKANEQMAHAYSHLYALPATGLRLFTVYGPWGRPDMAMYAFAASILQGKPIRLFNFGEMRRDFTYIDDVTEAVVRLLDRPAAPNPAWKAEPPDPASSAAPWRIYNVGNSRPVEIARIVSLLEAELGRSAVRELVAMQPGDVAETCADVTDLERDTGFRPSTPIEEGVRRFAVWYRAHLAGGSG
jgi:UDP-glucuronate 4-epimerase